MEGGKFYSAGDAGVFVYLYISLLTEGKIDIPMDRGDFEILRMAFYLLSAVIILSSIYFVKYIISGKWLKDVGKSAAGQKNQPLESSAIANYRAALIRALMMCQSIGSIAMILFFVGNNRLDLYLLLMMSAAGILYHRPKKDEILSMVQALKN
jgi:hypothetical protein